MTINGENLAAFEADELAPFAVLVENTDQSGNNGSDTSGNDGSGNTGNTASDPSAVKPNGGDNASSTDTKKTDFRENRRQQPYGTLGNRTRCSGRCGSNQHRIQEKKELTNFFTSGVATTGSMTFLTSGVNILADVTKSSVVKTV